MLEHQSSTPPLSHHPPHINAMYNSNNTRKNPILVVSNKMEDFTPVTRIRTNLWENRTYLGNSKQQRYKKLLKLCLKPSKALSKRYIHLRNEFKIKHFKCFLAKRHFLKYIYQRAKKYIKYTLFWHFVTQNYPIHI